jgi:hypothetical protein
LTPCAHQLAGSLEVSIALDACEDRSRWVGDGLLLLDWHLSDAEQHGEIAARLAERGLAPSGWNGEPRRHLRAVPN